MCLTGVENPIPSKLIPLFTGELVVLNGFLPFGGGNRPARSAHSKHLLSFLFCTLMIAFLF